MKSNIAKEVVLASGRGRAGQGRRIILPWDKTKQVNCADALSENYDQFICAAVLAVSSMDCREVFNTTKQEVIFT